MWAARARSAWGGRGVKKKHSGSEGRPPPQEPTASAWRPPFSAASTSSSSSGQGDHREPGRSVVDRVARVPLLQPGAVASGSGSVRLLPDSEPLVPPIKRLRKDAPPVIQQRERGSASKLLAIAENPVSRAQANVNFQELVYAPGTAASKRSRLKLWCDLAESLGFPAFPLTPELVIQAAGSLRAAGYRSGALYIAEARQQHVRLFGDVSGALQLAFQDAERGITRSLGPPAKAAEIRPEWWDALSCKILKGDVQLSREAQEPSGGLWPWGVATAFLLREVELAVLTLGQVSLDDTAGTVTITLAATKKDPRGRSAVRSRTCTCGRQGLISCPFCASSALLLFSLGRWGGELGSEESFEIPLVGTCRDAREFVQKSDLVSALCKDSNLLVSDAGNLVSEDPSGHTFRRSGAKHLARAGLPLARIQFYGRWGSSAVLGYVEEAMEESPYLRGLEPGWDEIKKFLSQALRNEVDPISVMPSNLKASLDELRQELRSLKTLSVELKEFIWPRAVLNEAKGVLHAIPKGKPLGSPALWKTHCGWRWACTSECEPITSETEPKGGVELCKKCLPSFDTASLPVAWAEIVVAERAGRGGKVASGV